VGDTDTQVRIQESYERHLEAGDVVFEEGAEGDSVYVIQSGEIELSRLGSAGRSAVARLAAGDFFGEMSAIVGERRTARAVAVTPSRLLELDSTTFEEMCVDRPEVAIRVIRQLTARLIDAEDRLAKLGIDDLLRPLVRVLVEAATPFEDGVRIETSLRILSAETGLSMLEAHRALHQLFDKKVLRLGEQGLVAPSVDALVGCLQTPA
jgi:CRP-like cAMP-binding protein